MPIYCKKSAKTRHQVCMKRFRIKWKGGVFSNFLALADGFKTEEPAIPGSDWRKISLGYREARKKEV